jgi:hypothetical protein
MCSIQDAFPDLNFNNTISPQEQKISKAKSELLSMQEERGKMMTFQCSDVTTPYFLQNQPNIPHIAKTTLDGDFSIAGSVCNCPPGMCNCGGNLNNKNNPSTTKYLMSNDTSILPTNNQNIGSFTPEIITDVSLLNPETTTTQYLKENNDNSMIQDLVNMVNQLDNKVNRMEHKYNNRNSHDMLLFIVIVIFVILVVDTLMKN